MYDLSIVVAGLILVFEVVPRVELLVVIFLLVVCRVVVQVEVVVIILLVVVLVVVAADETRIVSSIICTLTTKIESNKVRLNNRMINVFLKNIQLLNKR